MVQHPDLMQPGLMEDLDQMEAQDPMEVQDPMLQLPMKDQGKTEEDQLGIIMEEDLDHQATLLVVDQVETPMVEGPTVFQDQITLVVRGQEIMEVIMEEDHQEMEATPMVSGQEDLSTVVLDNLLVSSLVGMVWRRRAGEGSR